MFESANIFAIFGASFGLALVLGYVFGFFRQGRHSPAQNAVIRLRSASGMYRTRLVGMDRDGIVVNAPLQRDAYVPLRTGERLVAEAPATNGVLVGHCVVTGRESDSHLVRLRRLGAWRKVDRRLIPRTSGPISALLDGNAAEVVNWSEQGAMVKCRHSVGKGQRVRLDVLGEEDRYGWTLDAVLDGPEFIVRIRFE